MEDIFRRLGKAGVRRGNLYLAWDFTIASRKGSPSGCCRSATALRPAWRHQPARLRGRRRRAALRRDGGAPGVWADRAPDGRRALLARPARLPARLALQARPLPVRERGQRAEGALRLHRPGLVGDHARAAAAVRHGLFQDDVDTIALLAVATNAVICGTNFTGMANEDLPNAGMVSSDLSRFPTIADRLQQGILNFMFLGRAMIHPTASRRTPSSPGGSRPSCSTPVPASAGSSAGRSPRSRPTSSARR